MDEFVTSVRACLRLPYPLFLSRFRRVRSPAQQCNRQYSTWSALGRKERGPQKFLRAFALLLQIQICATNDNLHADDVSKNFQIISSNLEILRWLLRRLVQRLVRQLVPRSSKFKIFKSRKPGNPRNVEEIVRSPSSKTCILLT